MIDIDGKSPEVLRYWPGPGNFILPGPFHLVESGPPHARRDPATPPTYHHHNWLRNQTLPQDQDVESGLSAPASARRARRRNPNYGELTGLMGGLTASNSEQTFNDLIIPKLIDIWLDSYGEFQNVVETKSGNFSHLFDITNERLIAAWGIVREKNAEARDKARMAGHPLGAEKGSGYHRGHAIPHQLGGGRDINLVTQLGSVNVGAFRELERLAVESVGALYFTHWIYDVALEQKPIAVQQGLLRPGHPPDIRTHAN